MTQKLREEIMGSFGTPALLLVCVLLLTTGNCQKHIVSPNTVSAGEKFSVYCDASRLAVLQSGDNSVATLGVSRMVAGSTDCTLIAQYSNPPTGRDWVITFQGSNQGINNRRSMKIQVLVKDARNTDTGIFWYKVLYFPRAGGRWLSEISREHQVKF